METSPEAHAENDNLNQTKEAKDVTEKVTKNVDPEHADTVEKIEGDDPPRSSRTLVGFLILAGFSAWLALTRRVYRERVCKNSDTPPTEL